MTNSQEHWNRIWKQEGNDTWRKYPKTFDFILSQLTPKSRVLDLGGGNGVLAKKLLRAGHEPVVIDISNEAVAQCQEKGIMAYTAKIPDELVDIRIEANSVDAIIATEFFEHLKPSDMQTTLAWCAEKLKPNGKLLCAVPDEVLTPEEHDEHEVVFDRERLQTFLRMKFKHVLVRPFFESFRTGETEIALPELIGLASKKPMKWREPQELEPRTTLQDKPKVLIAAPIIMRDWVLLERWLWWIRTQNTYDNIGILLIPNGHDRYALEDLIREMDDKVHIEVCETREESTIIERCAEARETARRFAITWEYDKIFFLDIDTFPLIRDCLPVMIEHNKPMVSGVYFYKNTPDRSLAAIWAKHEGRIMQRNLTIREINDFLGDKDKLGSLIRLSSVGFGCILVDKAVFERTGFRYMDTKEKTIGEDVAYCYDAELIGSPTYLDPRLICKHIKLEDVEGSNASN